MTAPPPFRPSPDARLRVVPVGREAAPVMVLDGVLADPHALRDYAIREAAFAPVTDNLYPGVRAPMPLAYVEGLVRALDPLIRDVHALDPAIRLARAECFFSIVTTPPAALLPFQTIPHIDTTDPLQFATVHFLCNAAFGGTAFYRQRATGIETVDAAREPEWAAERDRALAAQQGTGYISAGAADYEQIALFAAAFDRMLVYRSNQLHSGDIPPNMPLSPDPAQGRLTATLFIAYRA